jgi:hypothetical protein
MEYKNYIIYPGTVFTARHYDQFTKSFKSHPFVCVYNQALDPALDSDSNIVGLLITSNPKQTSRLVEVIKEKNKFLENDSWCYCNNLYTFTRNDINPIGKMDSDTFFEIVKKRQNLLRSENDQCVQALMNLRGYEVQEIEQKTNKKRGRKPFNPAPISTNQFNNTLTTIEDHKLQVNASYFPNIDNSTPQKTYKRRNVSIVQPIHETQELKHERETFSFEGEDTDNTNNTTNSNNKSSKKPYRPKRKFYSNKKKN